MPQANRDAHLNGWNQPRVGAGAEARHRAGRCERKSCRVERSRSWPLRVAGDARATRDRPAMQSPHLSLSASEKRTLTKGGRSRVSASRVGLGCPSAPEKHWASNRGEEHRSGNYRGRSRSLARPHRRVGAFLPRVAIVHLHDRSAILETGQDHTHIDTH
jgi:hypothetical protein